MHSWFVVMQVLVAEPSVPDTISILRGLKERYEGHHGVRILDRALVVAAQLSSRYITGMATYYHDSNSDFFLYLAQIAR
jgi:ATP-dependent Clp protease ATP-binding subunit ClpA